MFFFPSFGYFPVKTTFTLTHTQRQVYDNGRTKIGDEFKDFKDEEIKKERKCHDRLVSSRTIFTRQREKRRMMILA